jgi:hypothetical protein
VVAALHEIGADLGDPVEVNLADGRVVVSGVGVAPERQREIRRAVAEIPHVSVEFSDPAAATAGAATPATGAETAAPARSSAIQSRMEQQLGGRAEFERFSGQLLDRMDGAMARVYALRSLAQRFPDGTPMAAADTTRLRGLARQHLTVLDTEIHDLHRTLAPVLVTLGGQTAQGGPVNERSWQAVSEELFRNARGLEVLLSGLLGATADGANAQAPTGLLKSFADVEADLDALSRTLQ